MALEIVKPSKIKKPLTIKQHIVLSFISLLIGITVLVIAYIGMNQNSGIGQYNQSTLNWMISHRESNITDIVKIITASASLPYLSGLVIIIVFIWLIFKREIWKPILLTSAMITATTLSMIVKNFTTHMRPLKINMIPPFEIGYSFPSGHTISMTTFLLVFGYLIYSRNFTFIRFIFWIILTIISTGIVGLSRLYLGYHWLTDVVASIGFSFILLSIIILIDMMVIRKFKKLN